MADVRAFNSCCPPPHLAPEVAALPYDVFSREEAAAEIRQHPLSFLRIDKSTACLPAELGEYAPEVYHAAGRTFAADLAQGVFLADKNEPAYFVYRLQKAGHTQTGVVACVSVDEYNLGRIKRHENTREHKQQDRVEHIKAVGAHTGPVFLAYRQQATVDRLVNAAVIELPELDFTSPDGVRHTVWRIANPELTEALRLAFTEVDSLYIADGHHRAAAAAAVASERTLKAAGGRASAASSNATTVRELLADPAEHFLAVLFPSNQVQILDYNRVIAGLNGLTAEELLARIAVNFDLQLASSSPYRPEQRGQVGLYVAGCWYKLTINEAARASDPVESLDVAILHDHLLAPILGVTDPRQDSRISYVGGSRGLDELAERADATAGAAFVLYPCSLDELFTVADAGRLMPPKSTWFEPKPRSGLFIHCIDEPKIKG